MNYPNNINDTSIKLNNFIDTTKEFEETNK